MPMRVAPPAMRTDPAASWTVNSSPRMKRAKRAFHRSETAPSGPRTTMGSAPIWKRVPVASRRDQRGSREDAGCTGERTKDVGEDEDGKAAQPPRALPVALAVLWRELLVGDVARALQCEPCADSMISTRQPAGAGENRRVRSESDAPSDWTNDAPSPTTICVCVADVSTVLPRESPLLQRHVWATSAVARHWTRWLGSSRRGSRSTRGAGGWSCRVGE